MIEIVTLTDGNIIRFKAHGHLAVQDGTFSVQYEQEKDFVALHFNSSKFQMKRSGSANVSCTFSKGKKSTMLIGGYGQTGEIAVETTDYTLRRSSNACSVNLQYRLKFSDQLQSFQLKLKIKTSEEK